MILPVQQFTISLGAGPLWDYVFWIAIALMAYGMLTILYKMNPLYDLVEGIGMGAMVGVSVLTNSQTVWTQVLLPLQTNFVSNWWVLFAVALGALFFCLYIRSVVEIFRFASSFVLAINLATIVRTNSTAIWAQVTASSQILNFSYLVLWLFFIFGCFYFIYSKKLEKPLGIPREIGRWVMIFELGALLTPMYLRYVEVAIAWTLRINASPAWFVPFLIFAIIAVDAINGKLGLIKRQPKEVVTKT